MANVIMYSTGCPKCKVLEAKLNQKGIEFSIESSPEAFDKLYEEGYRENPILEIDGKKYGFAEAVNIINNY